MLSVPQLKIRQHLEKIVNLLLVVTFLVLIGIFANRYLTDSDSPKVLKSGDIVSLPDLVWRKGQNTLLIFLQSDCKFSYDGAAFYVSLAKKTASRSDLSVITIFSKTDIRRQEFLTDIGLSSIESYVVDFNELGVLGRPLVALVDDSGNVQDIWKGVLSPKQENEVRRKLGLELVNYFISRKEVSEALNKGQKIQVLDVRNRQVFEKDPIPDSINMPIDEIPIRAINEITPETTIVINAPSRFFGESAQRLLVEQGFRNVFILNADTQDKSTL